MSIDFGVLLEYKRFVSYGFSYRRVITRIVKVGSATVTDGIEQE
jgi:hypothetical protein